MPSVVQKAKDAYKLWHTFAQNLPKTFRLTLGSKIDSLFVEILETAFTASYARTGEKLVLVKTIIHKTDLLKFFLQIAWEEKVLENNKYIMLSGKISETGKMLARWKKYLEEKTPPKKIGRENK